MSALETRKRTRRTQKHQRQPALLEVIAPPINGPATAPAPYAAPINEVMTGCRRRGSELAEIERTPMKTPAYPAPGERVSKASGPVEGKAHLGGLDRG